jgi:AAA+ superfamily predicted ATPase
LVEEQNQLLLFIKQLPDDLKKELMNLFNLNGEFSDRDITGEKILECQLLDVDAPKMKQNNIFHGMRFKQPKMKINAISNGISESNFQMI